MKDLLGKQNNYYEYYYDFRHIYDVEKLTSEYKRYIDRMHEHIKELQDNLKEYENLLFKHMEDIQNTTFNKTLAYSRNVSYDKKITYTIRVVDVPSGADLEKCYYAENLPGNEILRECFKGCDRHLFFKRIKELKKNYPNINEFKVGIW